MRPLTATTTTERPPPTTFHRQYGAAAAAAAAAAPSAADWSPWGQSAFPDNDPFAALSPDMFDAYPVDSSSFGPVAYGNDGMATEPATLQPVPFLSEDEEEDLVPQPSQNVGFRAQHHNWVAAPGSPYSRSGNQSKLWGKGQDKK